jgi:hypothetical protein
VITLENLEQMFQKMRVEAPFNVDEDLLWGYFFTDPDKKKLRPVADDLTKLGYREVALYLTDDKSTYFLHLERVETHTPQSLNERNAQFYALAERLGIEYDGMDVGPVGKGT